MAQTLNLSILIRAVDRVTAPVRRIGAAVHRVGRQTGLDRVAAATSDVGRGFGRVGRETLLLTRRLALVGAAAAGGLGVLTVGVARAGDAVAKTADKLGLTTRELQRYRYAADRGGVSSQTFEMATQRFGRRAAEAAAGTGEAQDALRFLGIELRDSAGRMRSTGTLMEDVADALAGIEDPLLRNRIAFKLFDSEGVAMVNVLKDGSAGLRALGDEAERLGLVMGEDQARASERFVDLLTQLSAVMRGLTYAIGGALLPVLEPLLVDFRDFATAIRPRLLTGLRDAIAQLADTVRWLRDRWTALTAGVSAWYRALLLAIPAMGLLITPMIAAAQRLGVLRGVLGAVVVALGWRLVAAVGSLVSPLARLVWWTGVATVRLGLLAAGAAWEAGKTVLGALGPAAALAAKGVRVLSMALRSNPIVAIALAIAGAAYLIYRHWDGIVAWVADLWAQVKAAFDLDALTQWLNQWDPSGTISGWVGAITGRVGALWGAVTGAFDLEAITAALAAWSPLETVSGWITAIAGRVGALWGAVTGAFDFKAITDAFAAWSPLETVSGWITAIAGRVGALWGAVTGAFDFKAITDAFAAWSPLETVSGWITAIAGRVGALWGAVTGAFDLGAITKWICGESNWGGDGSCIGRAVQAIADTVTRLWSRVTGAFDLNAITAALAAWSPLEIVSGWITAIAGRVGALWGAVTGAFDLEAITAALAAWSPLETVSGWITAIAGHVGALWGAVTGAFDLKAITDALGTVDWIAIGRGWIDRLWDGITGVWTDLVAWFSQAVRDLFGPAGGWILEKIGVSADSGDAPGAPARPARLASQPSITSLVRVGGEVRVIFVDAPAGLRVDRVRTLNPDVPIDVTAGYAMAGT